MKASRIACIIGVVGVVIALNMQYNLAIDFANTSSGKTRALFGIKHLLELHWSGIGLITILVALYGRFRKETWKTVGGPIVLGMIQILIVFLELWRLN